MQQSKHKNNDSNKGCIILFAILVYIGLFLIGPWHYYSELEREDELGILMHDYITGLDSAEWDNEILRVCLTGRIDGEDGYIYIEMTSDLIYELSIDGYAQEGAFRNVIELERLSYKNKCPKFAKQKFITININNGLMNKYYDYKHMKGYLLSYETSKYYLQSKTDDIGVNLHRSYFGVYVKNKDGDMMAWFKVNGSYHKEINADAFDCTWALIKDFVTMPYQWFAMIVYVSGGIG